MMNPWKFWADLQQAAWDAYRVEVVRSLIADGMTIAANISIDTSGKGSVLELRPGQPALVQNIRITTPPPKSGEKYEIFVD